MSARQGEPWDDDWYRTARTQALREGRLLDITETLKRCIGRAMPGAMTAGLWQALAPGEVFQARDAAWSRSATR